MRRIMLLVLGLIILNGCSSFQLSGTKQKTMVDKISADKIKVTFCGNAYMGREEVEKYALQRASREVLSKGYSHFIVMKKDDQSKICDLGSGMNKNYSGNTPPDSNLPEFVEPNVTLTIQCIPKGQKLPEKAIDAEEFLRKNFPGLQNK